MQIHVTIMLKRQEHPQIRRIQLEKPAILPVMAVIPERTQKAPAMLAREITRLRIQMG
jgi:hypothetical protein